MEYKNIFSGEAVLRLDNGRSFDKDGLPLIEYVRKNPIQLLDSRGVPSGRELSHFVKPERIFIRAYVRIDHAVEANNMVAKLKQWG